MSLFVRRAAPPSGEGQGYLVSVSDVMSGLMFIFIITLVVFSLRLKEAEKQVQETDKEMRRELEKKRIEVQRLQEEQARLERIIEQLTGGKAFRAALLENVEQALEEKGFRVQIDVDHGILRLPEEVLFPSGSANLQPEGEQMLEILGRVFEEVLPGFSIAASQAQAIASGQASLATSAISIEAIFIEGHTDNVALRPDSPFKDNWGLSTARGITTFKSLVKNHPSLETLRNQNLFPIFSVSGYADCRPVAPNDTPENMKRNRRIDIRFILTTPKAPPKLLDTIREILTNEGSPGE